MPILFVLFIIVPIAEMWVLIEVGSRIGALTTIGLVLFTAVVGVTLLRQQGLSTLVRANQRMQSGELPAQEMGEGIFLAIGGALLLTPGFITDAIGFACLIPGVRKFLLGRLLKRGFMASSFQAEMKSSRTGTEVPGPFAEKPSPEIKGGNTIDGEYHRDD